jgi:hypothetical protein
MLGLALSSSPPSLLQQIAWGKKKNTPNPTQPNPTPFDQNLSPATFFKHFQHPNSVPHRTTQRKTLTTM